MPHRHPLKIDAQISMASSEGHYLRFSKVPGEPICVEMRMETETSTMEQRYMLEEFEFAQLLEWLKEKAPEVAWENHKTDREEQ